MKDKVIAIDPTKLTPKLMAYLDALLPANTSELDGVTFDKDTPYPITYAGKERMVNLSHDVIGWRVETFETKRAWRFGVMSNRANAMVGAGGNGVVERLAGTLVKTGDACFDYRIHNRRVAKHQSLSTLAQVEDIKNEAKITREHPELHAKTEFVIGMLPAMDSYMVLGEVSGEELFKIIKRDMKKQVFLPDEERFKITLNMLYAFKRTNARKIIHRDIKPENILVDMPSCATQFLDFGLARYADKPDERSCGTPTTSAPEMLTDEVVRADHRADIYSLGLIAIIIWGGGFRQTGKDTIKSATIGDDRYLPSLKEFNLISPKAKLAILRILTRMISYQPEDRPTIDESIAVFEEVFLDYRLAKQHYGKEKDDATIKALLVKSYNLGLSLGSRLHEIRFSSNASAFEDLLKAVDTSLEAVTDERASVKVFVEAARVELFRTAISVQEIHDRAHEVVDGMIGYLNMFETEDEYINNQIKRLKRVDAKNEMAALITEAEQCSWQLRHMYHKASKPTREVTFDDMAEVYNKFKYFSENIKMRVEKLNESLFKLTSDKYPREFGLFSKMTLPAKVDLVELVPGLQHK